MIWTEETIDRLKAEHATGKALRQIARDWGVTPNTILGKVHRLKMASATMPQRRKKSAVSAPNLARVVAPICRDEPSIVGRPLLAAGFSECRWIIDGGNAADRLCCGARTVAGSSWCRAHSALVYAPRRGFVQRYDGSREISGAAS